MDIYDFLYNEEVLSRNHDAEMLREGRREGISIGEKRGISIGQKRGEAQILEKLINKGYITREQAQTMANI